ncbi:MAG TPA: prepilin-type N-terminal cleavage/methylation domain-containing protein, partial [Elusimicrobiota bacterium]|nr:prepilin-type N-terminal cleavage/methylation domain-containing protein [Elusimicrobiota bacterium]
MVNNIALIKPKSGSLYNAFLAGSVRRRKTWRNAFGGLPLKREVPVTHIHRRSGFTLIELMLVVAIIGLLAAIAVPKFANLVIKAKEASTRGKLGTVRSALSIYYADNEG